MKEMKETKKVEERESFFFQKRVNHMMLQDDFSMSNLSVAAWFYSTLAPKHSISSSETDAGRQERIDATVLVLIATDGCFFRNKFE